MAGCWCKLRVISAVSHGYIRAIRLTAAREKVSRLISYEISCQQRVSHLNVFPL